jgi:NADH dehydrogenase FAD-containing subunit
MPRSRSCSCSSSSQFNERLSAFARTSLEALGVEVRVDSRVEGIDAEGVVVSGERIRAGTVLWAASRPPSPPPAGFFPEGFRTPAISTDG